VIRLEKNSVLTLWRVKRICIIRKYSVRTSYSTQCTFIRRPISEYCSLQGNMVVYGKNHRTHKFTAFYC